jgi:hypothetical protein
MMPLPAWQALQQGQGPTVVPTWPCGDHGSEPRTELVVSARDGAIRVKDREYSCPSNREAEKFLKETDE